MRSSRKAARGRRACPACGAGGRDVRCLTVRALVRDDQASGLEDHAWSFCANPDCPVVYFSSSGRCIAKDALKTRVGLKEKDAPRPVCYCFGHSVESIRDEIARTGRSTVMDRISSKVRAGECRCELLNPEGTCCLGDVNRVVKQAMAAAADAGSVLGRHREVGGSDRSCRIEREDPHGERGEPSRSTGLAGARPPAVTEHANRKRRKDTRRRSQGQSAGKIPPSGITASIIAAGVASVCCVGPLLLLALGISGAWIGSLSALEPYRPIFMAVTVAFLAFAFRQVYRKPKAEACEPGAYCAHPRSERINRTILWIVTVLVVGLLAFPYVAPRLYAGNDREKAATVGSRRVILAVENMRCATCPITVRGSLAQVPGVIKAQATLDPPEVTVVYDPDTASIDDLTEATRRAGYPSRIKQDEGS
ncbi:MAG: mercuric transporter MerT family protein [Acidobacteriota bacterium]